MHDWNVTPQEAEEIQNRLRTQVQLQDNFALSEIKTVAGIDAAYKGDDGRCAVVVLSYPDLQPVEQATAKRSAVFPYTPGLLSFREMPLALDALGKLKTQPDLLMVDGQGGLRSSAPLWVRLSSGRPSEQARYRSCQNALDRTIQRASPNCRGFFAARRYH